MITTLPLRVEAMLQRYKQSRRLQDCAGCTTTAGSLVNLPKAIPGLNHWFLNRGIHLGREQT